MDLHHGTQVQKEWVARMKPPSLVNMYLMASYLYYFIHESPMTDDAYDLCCQRLDKEWGKIDHQHKHIIDR